MIVTLPPFPQIALKLVSQKLYGRRDLLLRQLSSGRPQSLVKNPYRNSNVSFRLFIHFSQARVWPGLQHPSVPHHSPAL